MGEPSEGERSEGGEARWRGAVTESDREWKGRRERESDREWTGGVRGRLSDKEWTGEV